MAGKFIIQHLTRSFFASDGVVGEGAGLIINFAIVGHWKMVRSDFDDQSLLLEMGFAVSLVGS